MAKYIPHRWIGELVVRRDVKNIVLVGRDEGTRVDAVDNDSSSGEPVGCDDRVVDVEDIIDIRSTNEGRKEDGEEKDAGQLEHLEEELVGLQALSRRLI